MTFIIISAADIQEHLEEHLDNKCLEITSFSWDDHRGIQDVEFEIRVPEDLHYESDDYIEIDEFNELKDNLHKMTEEFQESQDELALAQVELAYAQAAWANAQSLVEVQESQIVVLNAMIALNNIPWYKFW